MNTFIKGSLSVCVWGCKIFPPFVLFQNNYFLIKYATFLSYYYHIRERQGIPSCSLSSIQGGKYQVNLILEPLVLLSMTIMSFQFYNIFSLKYSFRRKNVFIHKQFKTLPGRRVAGSSVVETVVLEPLVSIELVASEIALKARFSFPGYQRVT